MSERHLLVFAGAGLTKSLERKGGPRVPLMADFIATMADYVDNDVIRTALSELDREHVFEHPFPEAQELAYQLTRPDGNTAERRAAYRALLKTRPAENIESLLARAESIAPNGIPLLRFKFAINAFFAAFGSSLDLTPVTQFLKSEFAHSTSRRTFVSFNYDLALDQCLQAGGHWHPSDGYGIPIKRKFSAGAASEHMQQFAQGGGSFTVANLLPLEPHDGAAPAVHLLKPHGSLDLLMPYEGNYNEQDGEPVVVVDDGGRVSYYAGFSLDHVRCGSGDPLQLLRLAPFLVPPAPAAKRRTLALHESLCSLEREAVRTATDVYVIGWSMPKTDEDQRALIRDNVAQRESPIERLVVINYGAGPDYYRDVADTFAVELKRVEVFNNGFTEYVRQCCGDAKPPA